VALRDRAALSADAGATRGNGAGAGAALARRGADESWAAPERPADFYDLKGVAELVLHTLKVSAYRFTPTTHPTFHPGRCAALEVMEYPTPIPSPTGRGEQRAVGESGTWVQVGVLGEAHPVVAEQFEIPQRTYLMELDLERLYAGAPEQMLHSAILRYPAATRDLAIVVAAAAPAAEVADTIRASGGPLLREARLFDIYTGEGIPAGKKSLAYTLTYQSSERTLTEGEIEASLRAIVAALKQRLGATLRT
jgi:phenylalanyl-tRNA synthetase beta chain